MKIDLDLFCRAISFIGFKHHITIEWVPRLGDDTAVRGRLVFKSPAIIIHTPANHTEADYTDRLCSLFHDWGCFLDVLQQVGDTPHPNELQERFAKYYDETVSAWTKEERVNAEDRAWDCGRYGCNIEGLEFPGLEFFLVEAELPSSKRDEVLARYDELRKAER